jgi:hypothetical protein
MTYMQINGVTIPVVSCQDADIEYGDRTPAYSGAARLSRRAIKRSWAVSSKAVTMPDYEAIRNIIRGQGVAMPFAGSLFSGDGLPPKDPVTAYADFQDNDLLHGYPVTEVLLSSLSGTYRTRPLSYSGNGCAWFGGHSKNVLPEAGWTCYPTTAYYSTPAVLGDNLYSTKYLTADITSKVYSSFSDSITNTLQPIVVSMYVRPGIDTNVNVEIDLFYGSHVPDVYTPVFACKANTWQRLEVMVTPQHSGDNFQVVLNVSIQSAPVGTTLWFGKFQVESGVKRATPRKVYNASGSDGYTQYDVTSLVTNARKTGLTIGYWGTDPDPVMPTGTAWSLGTTAGYGVDLQGVEASYGNAGEFAFFAQSLSETHGVNITNGGSRIRDLFWHHYVFRYLSDYERASLGTTDTWRVYRDGQFIASLTSTVEIQNLIVLTVGAAAYSGGTVSAPLWSQIEGFFIVPYGLTDNVIATMGVSPVTFGPAPLVTLGGDVVDNVPVNALGMLKSGTNAPRGFNGVWSNNARSLEFILTEA